MLLAVVGADLGNFPEMTQGNRQSVPLTLTGGMQLSVSWQKNPETQSGAGPFQGRKT